MEKMEFEAVVMVFDALNEAFHPGGVDEEAGLDDRYSALWTLFLLSAGWSEEEFWEQYDAYIADCENDECDNHVNQNNEDHLPPEFKSN